MKPSYQMEALATSVPWHPLQQLLDVSGRTSVDSAFSTVRLWMSASTLRCSAMYIALRESSLPWNHRRIWCASPLQKMHYLT